MDFNLYRLGITDNISSHHVLQVSVQCQQDQHVATDIQLLVEGDGGDEEAHED